MKPARTWALIVLVALGAVFIAFMQMLKPPPPPPPKLSDYGAVPAFSLTEAGGQTVSSSELSGTLWVADFIFTNCGGTCPMMTSTLYQLHHELDTALGVRFVSITVDPERDSAPALLAYAQNNGLPRDHWWFLTGDRSAIFSLAKDGFHLPVADSASEAEGRLITHSDKVALVDRTGHIRGYYDGTDSTTVGSLRRDIARLAREHSHMNRGERGRHDRDDDEDKDDDTDED